MVSRDHRIGSITRRGSESAAEHLLSKLVRDSEAHVGRLRRPVIPAKRLGRRATAVVDPPPRVVALRRRNGAGSGGQPGSPAFRRFFGRRSSSCVEGLCSPRSKGTAGPRLQDAASTAPAVRPAIGTSSTERFSETSEPWLVFPVAAWYLRPVSRWGRTYLPSSPGQKAHRDIARAVPLVAAFASHKARFPVQFRAPPRQGAFLQRGDDQQRAMLGRRLAAPRAGKRWPPAETPPTRCHAPPGGEPVSLATQACAPTAGKSRPCLAAHQRGRLRQPFSRERDDTTRSSSPRPAADPANLQTSESGFLFPTRMVSTTGQRCPIRRRVSRSTETVRCSSTGRRSTAAAA